MCQPGSTVDVLRSTDVVPVDVVIVAFGSESEIGWSVSRARRLGGQVVVVDHGDGASAQRAEAMGAATVHDSSNPGFGAGQNRGVAKTTSEFVLLCNPDARIVPLAVMEGVHYLQEHPGVAAVQGVIESRSTGRPEHSQGVQPGAVHLLGRAVGARRLLRFGVVRTVAARSGTLADHAERVPTGPVAVDNLAATALLVRRCAFDAVGGFDPSYFLYGEDLDLCRRFREAGWGLVALPRTWAVHGSGVSSPSTWDRELRWWEGTMSFAARWWARPAFVVAWMAAATAWLHLSVTRPRSAGTAARALLLAPLRRRHG